MKLHTINRRQALKSAAAVVAAPYFIPSGVLAAPGRPGANERLSVAQAGIGGMGRSHLRMLMEFRKSGEVDIPAVCDVDEERLAYAARVTGPGTVPCRDYRYMLERKDVDAVVFATPDHWHAVQMVQACESGKHVYVEKPASVTIAEGKAMVAAAHKYGRVVQVGSQSRSAKPAHDACTYIRNGMLGKVHTVKCWHTLNPVGGLEPDSAPPETLDWDLWLGPLKWRPYNNAYQPGSFRWLMESGGGVIRDRGAHMFSTILWSLDADKQAPVSIEATGSPPEKGIWDCPPKMEIVYTFKNPDWKIIWSQPGEVKGEGGFGIVFYGDKDSLIVQRDGTRFDAEEKARDFKPPSGGVHVYRMDKHEDYNMNHKEDWFKAIKSNTKPTMDIETAHRAGSLCILGNLSYVLGRELRWDGVKQEFIGDTQANRLLGRPQRHPYHL